MKLRTEHRSRDVCRGFCVLEPIALAACKEYCYIMYEYILPSGAKIDAERIVDAVLMENEYPQVYLDTELGALIEIPSRDGLRRWIEEIGETRRYFVIEHFNDADRNAFARYFIDSILTDMDSHSAPGARNALVRGGWREMEDFLENKTDGWIHGWDQYLSDEAWESVHEWLTNNPHVHIKAEFEGCGNCAACELIRKGEGGDHTKLIKAFETENIMQHAAQQLESRAREQISTPSEIFLFKITLNDSTPRVWRRIEVPATYTFFDLHCAIQDAMGWTDSHLHAFRLDTRSQSKSKRGDKQGTIITIEFPNPEGDAECYDERTEHIADWFGKRMTQCVYEYDFGDGWGHTVLFEKKMSSEPGVEYPRCTAGKNACPPEDCGGVGGYDDLQKVIKTPSHEEHEDMLEWLCIEDAEEFDPKHFDPAEIEFQDPVERLKECERGFGI